MKKKIHRRAAPDKVLSAILYTYVRPVNRKWVQEQATKKNVPYSRFLDQKLTQLRKAA